MTNAAMCQSLLQKRECLLRWRKWLWKIGNRANTRLVASPPGIITEGFINYKEIRFTKKFANNEEARGKKLVIFFKIHNQLCTPSQS